MTREESARARGKKRAHLDSSNSSLSSCPSPPPVNPTPTKKPRRAETKQCPVCREHIPLRLLPAHSELELERVEEILKHIGSAEVIADDREEGPSSQGRRSAARARMTLSAMNPRANIGDTIEMTIKTIQNIKRHRKQRHAKLREMTRDEEDGVAKGGSCDEIVCPICLQTIRGDQDFTDAHVDACLAHEHSRIQEAQQPPEDAWEEVEVDGQTSVRVRNVERLRGTGFSTRNRSEQDVEDEVDVDGNDEGVFGDAQFTEGDILAPANDLRNTNEYDDLVVEIESTGDDSSRREQTLQDLVAEGKVISQRSQQSDEAAGIGAPNELDSIINSARKQRNASALITALDNKITQLESMQASSPTTLVCRICLDPYVEPTVSTGCWHTNCRECWLRCLGSTKLCPICKRITAAIDLRRIYL